MPRITTKTNRDPSYGPDPQGATEGLLTSPYFSWTACSAVDCLALSLPERIQVVAVVVTSNKGLISATQ